MTDKIIKPVYKFKEVEGELGAPIKRVLTKTMEVTDEFNLFDTLAYVAKLKKEVDNKTAEIEGLNSMIKAFEDEIAVIEKTLGVQKMETEYQKEIAKKNEMSEKEKQVELEKQLKEELLKTGNFVEKDVKDN